MLPLPYCNRFPAGQEVQSLAAGPLHVAHSGLHGSHFPGSFTHLLALRTTNRRPGLMLLGLTLAFAVALAVDCNPPIAGCSTCTTPSGGEQTCTGCTTSGQKVQPNGKGCIARCPENAREDGVLCKCVEGYAPSADGLSCASSSTNKSSLSTGAIAGISVAAVVVVGGLAGFLCWWFLCRGKAA